MRGGGALAGPPIAPLSSTFVFNSKPYCDPDNEENNVCVRSLTPVHGYHQPDMYSFIATCTFVAYS